MNKEQAIEKLSKIKKNNENYLATHGTEIVDIDKIVIEDNQALDLAITALENSIDFKPFDFPVFENTLSKELMYTVWKTKSGMCNFEIYYNDGNCKKITSLCGLELKSFEFSEQGYNQACRWLNDHKRELCKQLAE